MFYGGVASGLLNSAAFGRVQNRVDLAPRDRVYAAPMARDGLLIGEVAAKSGTSRKALRLYEKTSILPPARRTTSGYRVYGPDTLAVLTFVSQARRLGFRLDEIKRIVVLKRSGQSPCSHVAELVYMKLESIQQTLSDLTQLRQHLRDLLKASQSRTRRSAAVCPCIEHLTVVKGGR